MYQLVLLLPLFILQVIDRTLETTTISSTINLEIKKSYESKTTFTFFNNSTNANNQLKKIK